MKLQSALTQTLYAQLLEEAFSYEVIMFEDGVVGSPYVNISNNRRYLYWQVKLPDGTFRRKALGLESTETTALVERLLARKRDIEEAISSLKTTTRAFVASGGMPVELSHFRVMEWLARAGLFSKSIVVVGSHAFGALGNAMGVRWGSSLKTTDMDFARPQGIALATPVSDATLNIQEVLKSGDDTFFAVPSLNLKFPATSMKSRKSQVRIDFLTTMRGKPDSTPVMFHDLGFAAEPLRYMDYLLEGPIVRGLLVGQYAIPANFPDPARFAIHKLIVAQERTLTFQTKVQKDVTQAIEIVASLIEVGREDDLRAAVDALPAYGYARIAEKIRKSLTLTDHPAKNAVEACLAQLPANILAS